MAKPSSRLRRRRRIRAGIVLALASTTSAVSLNDLQPVLDGLLPAACSLVYNTAMQGCMTADFARGETCSLSCIAGIKQVENNIEDPCQAVNNNALTLLNDALRGSLIVKLCVGNDFTLATTTSTSSSTRQTSTSALLTNPLVTTSQSVGSFSTIPFPATTSIPTIIPAQTTTLQSTATQSTLSFVPPPSLSTTALTTTQISSTTSQTPIAESTLSSTSSATTSTSTSTSTSQSGDGRGGGSPFDTTSQSSKFSLSWSVCLAAGALIATLRLS